MDQHSGNTTVGRQKMQQSARRKETVGLLNTSGFLIHNIESCNRRTDGLSSIASTSITSKLSMWTTLPTGMKEIDARTCSYCGIKTERIQET